MESFEGNASRASNQSNCDFKEEENNHDEEKEIEERRLIMDSLWKNRVRLIMED